MVIEKGRQFGALFDLGNREMRLPLHRFYQGLLESQWWSVDKLQALQRRHLTSLLVHARASSPYYRYRLDAVFRPNGAILWDKWSEIPIVKRADLSNNFNTMLSRAPVKVHGPFKDLSTSGSTGDPVTVRVTSWMGDMVAACNWRAQKWHDVDWSRTLVNRVSSDAPGMREGDVTGPWGPPWDKVAARGNAVFLPKTSGFADVLDAIGRHRDCYAVAGSNFVLELVALNKPQRFRVKGFLVKGEAVSAHHREAAASSFGASLLELYSSKECGPIAHPCPLNPQVFHINDEALLLEIVDERGQPCRPGVAGRVVLTPFAATALPLIRYDQGDIAIAGQSCSCGRGLSVIQGILGRQYDAYMHPDGRRLLPIIQLGALRPLISAKRWQVAQVGPNRYVVRLPPGVAYNEGGFAEFAAKAKEVLFGDGEITFERDFVFSADMAGKFKEYVNEWATKE